MLRRGTTCDQMLAKYPPRRNRLISEDGAVVVVVERHSLLQCMSSTLQTSAWLREWQDRSDEKTREEVCIYLFLCMYTCIPNSWTEKEEKKTFMFYLRHVCDCNVHVWIHVRHHVKCVFPHRDDVDSSLYVNFLIFCLFLNRRYILTTMFVRSSLSLAWQFLVVAAPSS